METVDIKVEDTKPYEKNAKKHSKEQVHRVAESIKQFGWRQPIVVDENLVIIIGHCRWLASKELGLEVVPCFIAKDLSEEQVKALRLVDNKVNESEWDIDTLELELLDLIDVDMSEWFEVDEEEELKKQVKERNVKNMQIKQFEHHDYIVFVFDNQMDWLNVVSNFKLENVNSGYGKTKKIGLGRVINGKRLLEALGYQSSDTEQGESIIDIDNETIA